MRALAGRFYRLRDTGPLRRPDHDEIPPAREGFPAHGLSARNVLARADWRVLREASVTQRLRELDLSDYDIGRLASACSGSQVYVQFGTVPLKGKPTRSLMFEAGNPYVFEVDTRRHLVELDGGGLQIVNELIHLRERKRRSAYATLALALQVRTATRLGVRRIVGLARGGDDSRFVGHIVWPRLGYDGRIPEDIWAAMPQTAREADGRQWDSAPYLQEFLAGGEEAREAWEIYGQGFTMRLELDPATAPIQRLMRLLELANIPEPPRPQN